MELFVYIASGLLALIPGFATSKHACSRYWLCQMSRPLFDRDASSTGGVCVDTNASRFVLHPHWIQPWVSTSAFIMR